MDITNFIFGSVEILTIGLLLISSLVIAIWFGRQSLINLICATYLALLFYLTNPLLSQLSENLILKISLFLFLVSIFTLFANRIMPPPYLENKFETLGKKILLATAFTILCITIFVGFIPITYLLEQSQFVSVVAKNELYIYAALSTPIILTALN